MVQAIAKEPSKYMTRINYAIVLTALLVGAGCQSSHTGRTESSAQLEPPAQPVYTIELIPNPQLTATSREGDNRTVVYSKNIVAVYLRTNQAASDPGNARLEVK